MFVSISCFSDLLDMILAVLNLAKENNILDDETMHKLEEKVLDFILFATEPNLRGHKEINTLTTA